jgi:hypothetical protein
MQGCPRPRAAMPRDGADHHDLRGICQGNRCGRESAEYIDDLRTPRAFSRPLASRARSRAPSSALGSQRTLRWRKPDSIRRYRAIRTGLVSSLVDSSPNGEAGERELVPRRSRAGSAGATVRILFPPAASQLRTWLPPPGRREFLLSGLRVSAQARSSGNCCAASQPPRRSTLRPGLLPRRPQQSPLPAPTRIDSRAEPRHR